jgi:glycosyltransferase involved in cell wall biosynthesis
VRRQLGIPDAAVFVLFVGGDWHGKGLAVAIEALAETVRRSPVPLRLVVVGRGDERHFGRLASRLGVEDHVTFTGPRRDTERFYAAADVYLLASHYETFSLAAHEAAACGVPIVSTRVSGVEELVGDGQAGFLVDRTPLAIASALSELAASPEMRLRAGAVARERARQFTWDASAAAIESVYRLALGAETRDLQEVAA